MALFKYKVTLKNREDFVETGTIRARDKKGAKKKLQALDFRDIHLKQLSGISAFLKGFTADVK